MTVTYVDEEELCVRCTLTKTHWRDEQSDPVCALCQDEDALYDRAIAAEARAADLLEANREQAEALEIVRAERDGWKDGYITQRALHDSWEKAYYFMRGQRDEFKADHDTLRASLAAEEAAHRTDVEALRAQIERLEADRVALFEHTAPIDWREHEAETPLGQALDGLGDEVEP